MKVWAHRSPDGSINLFRSAAHAAHLNVSASYVTIPGIPESHFLRCIKMAVARNGRTTLLRGTSLHSPPRLRLVRASQPDYTNRVHVLRPLPASVIEDFDRAAPRGTGGAKVSGNYAPVIRHTDKARAQAFHVTLHLDAQTRTCIEEFSTSGFGIKKVGIEVVVVVPDPKNIVQSITSDSCLALAESFGWRVEKREIPWSECKFFDEVIAVGTAASLLSIRLLARPSTSEKFLFGEATGECTLKLQSVLRDIMRGKNEDQFGWVDVLKEEDLLLAKDEKPEELLLTVVNTGFPVINEDVHEKSGVVFNAPVEVRVKA
ncbi:aminotransferase [Paraphoma chrysanthemicola]|uniref:Aminotransferase n=1 Tax=Paraphoma chrysanthemicola TaxID=798071 RepID=A0A8K0VYM5_9PLEO|nr:aminotransferase [Paraphoma chrysanthemicola]